MSLLKMSISAAVLILVIASIRALLMRRLPKQTFLLLWGIVLLRLLIPFNIPSNFSVYSLLHKWTGKAARIALPAAGMPATHTSAVMADTALPLSQEAYAHVSPLMVIWLAGLLIVALYYVATHLHWRREYRMALPVNQAFVQRWKHNHPLRRPVAIRQSDRIPSPLTYGIFRPVVLLPKHTDWTDEARLGYILAHEWIHIRRFDTGIKCLVAAALCIHWFNPLVWLMVILINRDIELACDEAVVRNFGGSHKSAYALTLIGLEEKKAHCAPLVNHIGVTALEGRIQSIMRYKKASRLSILTAAGVVMASAVVFATSADARESKPIVSAQAPAALSPGGSPSFILEAVSLAYYDNGWPYLHDIKTNHTDKTITGVQYGMLAYDALGNPLKLQWNFLDSSSGMAYDQLVNEEDLTIQPHQTYNPVGGWSLYDSETMNWPGMEQAGPNKVAYALYQVKEITFEDGTVWANDAYTQWLTTYKGKFVDVADLQSYYPLEHKITP